MQEKKKKKKLLLLVLLLLLVQEPDFERQKGALRLGLKLELQGRPAEMLGRRRQMQERF